MNLSVPARRYHNLDLYRGVLMVAGVWLHTAIAYFDPPFHTGESDVIDLVIGPIVFIIHLFRMPAFFILSGFFGAMLWERRGPGALLWHRLKRIGGPFLLFLPLLWQVMKFMEYMDKAFRGGATGPGQAALEALGQLPELPGGTIHLWFIYYLLWIHAVVVAGTWCVERQPALRSWLHQVGRRMVVNPRRSVIGIAGLHLLWRLVFGWQEIPTSNEFVPDPTILAYYAAYFGVGWVLWRLDVEPEDLIGTPTLRRWVAVATLALVTTTYLSWVIRDAGPPPLDWYGEPFELAFSVTLITCNSLSTLGLVWLSAVLFLRLPDVPRPAGRYLSDASYWIYLIHLPFAFSLPHLFWWSSAPPVLHYLGTVVVVFAVCLLSYDALVRDRWLGTLLNGRRAPPVAPWLSFVIVTGLTAFGIGVLFQYAQRDHSSWRASDPSRLLDVPATFPYPTGDPDTPAGRCLRVASTIICPGPVAHDEVVARCADLSARGDLPWSPEQAALLQEVVPAVTQRAVWVPVRRAALSDAWRWLDGTVVSDPPFAPSQPNGSSMQEQCVVLNKRNQTGWVDLVCERLYGFICLLPADGKR